MILLRPASAKEKGHIEGVTVEQYRCSGEEKAAFFHPRQEGHQLFH